MIDALQDHAVGFDVSLESIPRIEGIALRVGAILLRLKPVFETWFGIPERFAIQVNESKVLTGRRIAYVAAAHCDNTANRTFYVLFFCN